MPAQTSDLQPLAPTATIELSAEAATSPLRFVSLDDSGRTLCVHYSSDPRWLPWVSDHRVEFALVIGVIALVACLWWTRLLPQLPL